MAAYDYAAATGYARSRSNWIDYPNVTTPVLASNLNRWDQALADLKGLVFNVKDYLAKGDGVTDDYAGIQAAYTALVAAGGGTLYFPTGVYRFLTALSFSATSSRPIALVGDGAGSILAPEFVAGDAITVNGDGSARIRVANLAIKPQGASRSASTYNLVLSNGTRVFVNQVTIDGTGGGLKLDSCMFYSLNGFQCDSTDGSSRGETGLRIVASSGDGTNVQVRTGSGVTGYTNCKPPLYVTGSNSEVAFTNSRFQGAGPRSQFTVTGVTSDAGKFTVTTSATHDFRVGDFVVLRGMTPSTYNSQWRVATVPTGTTLTVTSTANPGTSSVNGTAESVAACGYVSNEDSGSASSVNESRFTGCIFEAIQTGLYGSAALYMDGRRGNTTQSGTLAGWSLTGNYFDQYATGLLLSGMASNSSNEPTVYGFAVSGNITNTRTRGYHFDQVQGVTLDGSDAWVPGSVTPGDDGVSTSAALYIYAGPAAPFSQGINVGVCQLGMGRNWQNLNNTAYKNGVLLDAATINDLVISGSQAFGTVAAIGEINAPQTGSQRWKIRNNLLSAGTFPPTAAEILPSIASATAIAVGYQDVQKVTGTTNIQTLVNGGWPGRELTLAFVGALSLVTGGNLAIGANYAVLAGQMVTLVFDGSFWYVK